MGQFFILRSRVQQEYNGLRVNALNRIFKSNLSLNAFKWLLTKVELSVHSKYYTQYQRSVNIKQVE